LRRFRCSSKARGRAGVPRDPSNKCKPVRERGLLKSASWYSRRSELSLNDKAEALGASRRVHGPDGLALGSPKAEAASARLVPALTEAPGGMNERVAALETNVAGLDAAPIRFHNRRARHDH
jgi:hypothetical protein